MISMSLLFSVEMGIHQIFFLILGSNVLKLHCQINISVLHIHDNDWYSKEAVLFAATSLNNDTDFNIHVDLVQQHTFDCRAIANAYNDEKPLHIIIDTLHQHGNKGASDLGIPTITTSFENDNLSNSLSWNLFKVQHPSEMLQSLLYNLIKFLEIDNVLVVYDPNFFYLEILKSKLQEEGIPNLFLHYNNLNSTIKVIKYLNYNQILFLGDENIKSLINVIKKESDITWHILSIVPLNETINSNLFIYPSNHGIVNIEISTISPHKGNLFFNFYADVAMMAMQAARDFVESSDWEFESVDCSKPTVERNMDLIKYLKTSKTIFAKIGLDYRPALYYFGMMLAKDSSPESSNMGVWRSNYNGIRLKEDNYWKELIRKKHFKILAVVKPPFIYLNRTVSANLYGYCIDMIEELSKSLNFTYELHPGSTAMEMVNNITNYDIVLGGVKTSSKLMEYLDFTEPFYKPVGIGILIKRPVGTSIFKFITVMDSTVWLCVIAAYFLNSFMIWAFERWSPYSYKNNQEKFVNEDDNRDFTLRESLWFCIMSITPQGGGDVPKHFSGRMAVITWWIFGFIVLSSYTANLAAFLTLSKLKSSVESFDDLSRQFMIKYAPLNNSEELDYFNNMLEIETMLEKQWRLFGSLQEYEKITPSDYPLELVYHKMSRNMHNTTFPQTMDEAVERIKKSASATEGFGLIGEISDIRYLAMTHCDLEVIDDELSRIPYALAVRKNSFLKGFLNKGIFDLMRKRRFEQYEKTWWDDNPYKANDCTIIEDHWQGVGMQNIGGVFCILFVGIGIACLTIFYEYLRYKYIENKANIIKVANFEESNGGRQLQANVTDARTRIDRY